MTPIRTNKQRITFAPTSLDARGTPRRSRPAIKSYARLKRINEPIKNPTATPCHTQPPSQLAVEVNDDNV
jgi:hypothetical protein